MITSRIRTFSIDTKVSGYINRIAAQKGISISSFVNNILTEYLIGLGIMEQPKPTKETPKKKTIKKRRV